ncbi:hypothetical protein FACS189413_04140 [Bacteroidia bacterium]|nr:hypothetical protein FACS189413_04140 [Bacteroidia bacterium]
MYKRFTQDDDCYPVMKEKTSLLNLNPHPATIAFLLQFACAFHVEKDLPAGMSGFMLN